MKKYDVVLLTEAQYIKAKNDWYSQQVVTEDRLVQEALEKEGLRVLKMNWDNPNFDWTSTAFVLFRTTWDYSRRFNEFFNWLKKIATQTKLINSASLIHWNVDKHYLKTVQDKGINIPPTVFIEPQSVITLNELQKETGWEEMVLKPTISAGGRHTYRLNSSTIKEQETTFQELISNEAMMLQPFLKNIVSKGEIALMVIGGKVTHAVLKKAKKGDFRVQDDFGGSVHSYKASAEEIAFAEKAIDACIEKPIYARVDIVWDNNNKLALSEIELIEPEMWFREYVPAATLLAKTITNYINSNQ